MLRMFQRSCLPAILPVCICNVTALKDITPYIKYTAPLPHDGRLVVLDRVFTRENVDNLRNLLQYKDTNWVFTGFDPEENGKQD